MTSRTELLVSKSATDHVISSKEKGKTKVKSDEQLGEDDSIGGKKRHCGCLKCFSLWPKSVSPDVDSNNCPSNETTQEFKPEKRLQNSDSTYEHNRSLTSFGYPTTEDKKETQYLSYGYLNAKLCTQLFPNNPIWSDGACQDRDLKARDVFHFLSLLSILKYSTLYLASYKFDKGLVWIKVTQAKYKTNAKNNLRCLKLAREQPFFAQLISAFKTQHGFYIVSTCQGRCTLDYYLKLHGALKVKDVQFYAVEIVHALVYLHEKEVIHRSLSSHNIMLDNTGHLFISDFSFAFFGLSCASQDFDNSANSYKAPEILNGQAYTKAVDWWALGVIIYEMLYCQLPFEGRDVFQSIVTLITLEPIFKYKNYGSKAIDFCRALLAKSASKRLGSGPDGSYNVLSHTFLQGVDWSNLRWRPAETHLLPADYTSCCSQPEDCDSLCSAESNVTVSEWQEKRAVTKKANKYFKPTDRDLKTERYQGPRSAPKEDAQEPQRAESKTLILHPRNPHRENFISSTLSTLDKVYVLKVQPGEGEPQESPARGPALRAEPKEKRAGNSSQVDRAERGSTDENASASGTAAEEHILNIFQVRRSQFKGFTIVSKGSVSASEVCTRRNSGEEDEWNGTSLCDTARHELCVSSDDDGDDIGREWLNSVTGIDKDIQRGIGKDGDQRDRMPGSKIGSGKGNHRGGGWIGGKTISDTFSSAWRLDTKPEKQGCPTVIDILPPAQSHKHQPQSCKETIRADGIAALESDENISKTITVDNTGKAHCILGNRRTSTLVNNMDRSNTTSTDGYHNNNSNNGDSWQPNKDETSDNQGASQHGPHATAIKRVGSRSQLSKGEGAFQDVVQCEGPEDIKNGTAEAISSCTPLHGVGHLPLGINDVPSATQSFKEASGQRYVPNIDVHVTFSETVSSLYNGKPPKNPGLCDNLYRDATTLDSDSYWCGQSDPASCHHSPLVDNLCFGDTPLTNANRDSGSGGVSNETLVDFFLCNGSQSMQLKELVAIGCTNDRVVSEMSTKSTDLVISDHHGQHQSQEPAAEWTHNADAMICSSPPMPHQLISHQEHDDALQCSNSNVESEPWASRRSPQNARPATLAPTLRKAFFLGYVTRKLEGNTNERPGPSSGANDLDSSVSATMSTSSAPETLAAHRAFYANQSTRRPPLSDQHSQGSGSYKVYLNKIESPPSGSSRARRWGQTDVERKAKAAMSSYEQFRVKLSFLNLFKRRNVAKTKCSNKKSQLPARLPETLKEVEPRKKKSGFFLLRKRSRTSDNDGTRSFTSALHDDDTGPSQGTGTFTGVIRREDLLRHSVIAKDADSDGVGFTHYYKTVTKQDVKVNSKSTGAAPQSMKFQKRKSTSEDSNSGIRSLRISSVPTTQYNDTAPNPTARSLPEPVLSGVNGNQSADETSTPPKHAPRSVVLDEHRPGHSPAEKNAFSGLDFDCDLMTPELPISRGQRVMELQGEIKGDLVLENSVGGESMHQNNSSDDGPETNGSGLREHIKTVEGASMAILERGFHHVRNDMEDTTTGLGLIIRGHLAEEAEYNLGREAEHYWSASKLKFQGHSFSDLDKIHDDAAVDGRKRAERKLQSKSALELCQEPLKMLPKCKSVHHLNLILGGKPRDYCLDKFNLRYPRKASLKLHLSDEKLYECDTVNDLRSNFFPADVGQVIRRNDLDNVPNSMEPSYLVTSPDEVYPSVAPHSNEVFNSPAAEPSPDSNMEASSGIKSLVELYPLIELHSSETFNSYVVEPSLDKNVELEHPHRPSSDTEEKKGAGETSKTISRHPPEDKSPEQSAFQRRRQLMSDLDAITPCNDCDVWPRNDRRCGRLRQVNYDTSSRYLYGDVSSNDHGQGEGLEVIGTLTIECLVPPVHGLIYRNHVTS